MCVVEIQGLRDNQPHGVLVTVEPQQASETGKSQRKSRKRLKRRKKSGETVNTDISSENGNAEVQSDIKNRDENSIKYVSSSQLKQSRSSHSTQDTRHLSAGSEEGYPSRPYDDGESEEFFEVKRYPAYHYDMYGTMYSLTDGVRPTTLEKGTIKSASADCLDVLGVTAQPLERQASVDEVTQSSAVTAKQRKPKPPAKPLKPFPRPKPRAKHNSELSKGSAVQPAVTSASTDTAFVEELSSLLKQRNQ